LNNLIASCQDSIAEVASIYDVIETVVTEFTMISNIKSHTKLRNTKIDAYLALPLLDRKADPMAWWSVHRRNFRVLAVVTRRYLSAPPSSVASEQLFSGAGNIVTDKRCKLSADKTEMLLALKYNLPLVNLKY